MNKSFKALVSLVLVSFLIITPAMAADLPVLTWERGKEQNVVLGGSVVPQNWKLRLTDNKGTNLSFKRSAPNANGFVVYSTFVPIDFPAGTYFVEVVENNGEVNSIVSGINVIEMQSYSIVQIPTDLMFVILYLVFIFTLLSLSRARKYRVLSFLSPEPPAESDLEKIAKSNMFSVLQNIEKFRTKTFGNGSVSLFSFILRQNDATVRKLSGQIAIASPLVSLVAGLIIGSIVDLKFGFLPYLGFIVFLVIGCIDYFSALVAGFSFISAQIALGQVDSFRKLLLIVFSVSGVLFANFVSELFFSISNQDLDSLNLHLPKIVYVNFLKLIASVLGGGFYFFTILICFSLSEAKIDRYQNVLFQSLITSIFCYVKFAVSAIVDKNYSLKNSTGLVASYKIESITGLNTLLTFSFLMGSLVYIWSQDFQTSIISALFISAPLVFITFNVLPNKLASTTKARKIPRNATIEPIVLVLMTYGLYQLIALQPIVVIQKSDILLMVGFSLVTVHALFGSLGSYSQIQDEEVI